MPLTPGQRLASYEIVSALGAGGMGEVYRARDPRLGRDVALKILPPDVTNEPGRLERFDREARAIAALNHPHIVTIYSTEEADGIRFLTMELVDGPTLSDLVTSPGMPIAAFLDIAMPLADALSAAHQKQITHRDLKPGNVMLSRDGRVKVLDFGLARVGGGGDAEPALVETLVPITQHGVIVGTMPYMSPEQVEGRAIDVRSDLFSLGVIFYELLAGERPFKGSSSPALMTAILRDSPAPLADRRDDVPPPLHRLVDRLLEKRPEDRVQTARDVFNELRHLRKQHDSSPGRPSSSTPVPSSPASASAAAAALTVTVLPFVARHADDESRALADGLTDEIIAGLSRFGYLRVLPRSVGERGAAAARYAIEGVVRRSGSTIRITVTLVDTQSTTHLWTSNYDRDAGADAFTIQDEVASTVVTTIADQTGVLVQSMASAIADRPLEQLSSIELVVRYHLYQQSFRADEHLRLRTAFETLLAREPRCAEAWACVAMLYEHERGFNFNPLPDPLSRQRRAAEQAVELDPRSQQAWIAMASTHAFARDREGLKASVERAVALNPLNADLVASAAIFLSLAGENDRAVALMQDATRHKPQAPGWYRFPAFNAAICRDDYDTALREIKAVSMPKTVTMQSLTAAVAGHLGRTVEARVAIDALRAINASMLDVTVMRPYWAMSLWDDTHIDKLVDGFTRALTLAGSSDRAVR